MNNLSNSPLYDVLDNLSERLCQSAATKIAQKQRVTLRDVLSSKANHSDIYEFALRDGIYGQLKREAKVLLEEKNTDVNDKEAIFNVLHPHFSNNTPAYITSAVKNACVRLGLLHS